MNKWYRFKTTYPIMSVILVMGAIVLIIVWSFLNRVQMAQTPAIDKVPFVGTRLTQLKTTSPTTYVVSSGPRGTHTVLLSTSATDADVKAWAQAENLSYSSEGGNLFNHKLAALDLANRSKTFQYSFGERDALLRGQLAGAQIDGAFSFNNGLLILMILEE